MNLLLKKFSEIWNLIHLFFLVNLAYFLPKQENYEQNLAKITEKITQEYSDVHQITPATLVDWLSSPRIQPTLIDTRQPEEFAISHLPNAIHISPDTPLDEVIATKLPSQAKDDLIVVYCSVGYRSSIFARKLKSAGFTNVHNLIGSIFAWANQDQDIYQGEKLVKQVHPYNRKWAQLLKPEYRAEV